MLWMMVTQYRSQFRRELDGNQVPIRIAMEDLEVNIFSILYQNSTVQIIA